MAHSFQFICCCNRPGVSQLFPEETCTGTEAVARAMQMLRGYTAQGRTSSARSGLVEGTMVWTVAMPAENSAELVEELSSHVASEADWQRMAVV